MACGRGVISLPPLPLSSEYATSGGFKCWRFRLYSCSNLPSSAYLYAPSLPSMETCDGTQKNLYCLDEPLFQYLYPPITMGKPQPAPSLPKEDVFGQPMKAEL